MTNWEIGKIVNYLINKSQTGNTFGSDELETMINYGSDMLFKRRLGMPEEYQLTPLTQQSYAVSTRITESLGVFIVNDSVVFVNGVLAKPSNYIYPISMIYNIPTNDDTCGVNVQPVVVELIDEGEYAMRRISALTPVNQFYPVYRVVGSNFKISPVAVTHCEFSYLKLPNRATVVTTLDSNDNEVYSSSSVELEWGEVDKLDIISIILASAGLNLRSTEIVQVAEKLKATGI